VLNGTKLLLILRYSNLVGQKIVVDMMDHHVEEETREGFRFHLLKFNGKLRSRSRSRDRRRSRSHSRDRSSRRRRSHSRDRKRRSSRSPRRDR
jgi:hypothetical protein